MNYNIFEHFHEYVLNLGFYKFWKNSKRARFVNEHFANSTVNRMLKNSLCLDCLCCISLKMQKQK